MNIWLIFTFNFSLHNEILEYLRSFINKNILSLRELRCLRLYQVLNWLSCVCFCLFYAFIAKNFLDLFLGLCLILSRTQQPLDLRFSRTYYLLSGLTEQTIYISFANSNFNLSFENLFKIKFLLSKLFIKL